MFIKKKVFKEKIDLIDQYKNLYHCYLDKFNELEKEVQDLKAKNEKISKENEKLASNNLYIKQNNELIDWIYKIINDVGYYKVNTDISIRIPIINKERAFLDTNSYKEDEIILPSIHFVKSRY